METTAAIANQRSNSGNEYDDMLAGMVERFSALGNVPLFTTDADNLWELYLDGFPASERQFHNCSACQHFIRRFGGLVRIGDDGKTRPAIWKSMQVPDAYEPSIIAMELAVRNAKVTGVFLCSDEVWGTPRTGEWTHFHVIPDPRVVFTNRVLTAGQAMATKAEDHKNVLRALEEFSVETLTKALALLNSDALYRAEKVIGPAQWLADLHAACAKANRNNVVWRAVATAPEGFCHPRSSMIGTLLEDIALGMDFALVSRRFANKMAPSRYQRPQAAPSVGAIQQAEKLVEQLGIARSLERRYAKLEELRMFWLPVQHGSSLFASGSIFGHLVPKGSKPAATTAEIPSVTMTWEKFVRTVLQDVDSIEVLVPESADRFAALVTATHEDAPPILAWDREGRRNPFSWYYASGIDAEVKKRVTRAGGQYENVDIRASLVWNNRNDLDLHAITPRGEHIYFGHKQSSCSGWLDVDMNVHGETTEPVENIRWGMRQAGPGRYQFFVENYRFHERSTAATPFRVELKINGELFVFDGATPSGMTHEASRIVVAEFDYTPGIRAVCSRARKASANSSSWGIAPGSFVKATGIVLSPNQWETDGVHSNHGRHVFFLLEGCRDTQEGVGRGFFPEMLQSELRQVRSTLEAYAASATIGGVDTADACGLGMSDQAPWDLTLRVQLKSGVRGNYKIDRWD
jgi:hypothetical protein